uniref:odorant receptor Or1-like n=1 Tax=Bombus vancouverensis nearcticus TaxID=2705178 RepID=UPI00143ADB83|nr:odorant receptor Or1-like [Bombus vancouverensis nearcticus]
MTVRTLQFSRVLLSIAGCLPPSSWTSPFTKSLYKFYTLFVWLLILSLVSAQILDIIINVENQDQFSDNFYITLVVFVSGCKLSIILKHRESILSLIESLEREPFSPMNDEEEKIQMKFNKTNERIAICYTILVEVAAIWIFVRAFLTDFKKRKLVFRAWLPYDYSELLPYTFSYAYEVATSLLCSCQNVASDTLFAGLLIQINGQFEILEERLRNIEEDSNYSAKQCVKHYQQIYKFSKTVNEKFKIILFLQFCTIAFTLCFNLYRMTNITMLSKFLEASLFLVRIIAQILYYCWFSNEVKLKSLQVPAMIFKSNWASWDTKTKKILLVIMTRATHPIEFTSGYLVTLNIDSFVALMKTSYSVFNLLQQTKCLVLGRKTIINMLDLLKNKPFVPENNGEGEIHARYDNLIEKVAVGYTIQVTFCVFSLLGTTLMGDFQSKKLMFRAWFPFDITSSWFAFSMTFLYQFVGLVIISNGVCIFDTLFAGLLLHICCQLEMLVYRLHNIEGNEIQSIKHCVWHHNKIFSNTYLNYFSFADIVNQFFNKLMFVQFVESAISICFTLYLLTDIEDTAQLIGWSSFMFAAIFQTFYFCWFGDVAKVKSLDISNMVYNSDWPNLSNDARKMLVVIMARSLTPVEITSAYILPMNLESFKGLMKVAYSAYNMLLQSQSSE